MHARPVETVLRNLVAAVNGMDPRIVASLGSHWQPLADLKVEAEKTLVDMSPEADFARCNGVPIELAWRKETRTADDEIFFEAALAFDRKTRLAGNLSILVSGGAGNWRLRLREGGAGSGNAEYVTLAKLDDALAARLTRAGIELW